MSAAEDELAVQLRAAGIEFERQFRFHPVRKWKADFRVGKYFLVEVQGGAFVGGRHTRGAGYTGDCERMAEAVLMGWRVLWFTPAHVRSGFALDCIERAIRQ